MNLKDETRLQYHVDAGTEICRFVTANNPVDIIEGPLGSGKTKGMCVRIMRHAQEQQPSPIDGIQRTRFAIVRNTYPDLKRTTIRTWLETFPEHIYGKFNWAAPYMHKIKFGTVDTEIDFLALDKPDDVQKLRSTEYTGIAFNELPFIAKEIFDEADSRLRYPPKEHGGPTWRGLIGDANAPDEDHWLALMTGQVDFPPGMTEDERAQYIWPEQWGFFRQPAALIEERDQHGIVIGHKTNPKAENLRNLPEDYYERMIRGKSKAWIDSRLMNRVTLVTDGSAVWPMFNAEAHVSREVLRPVPHNDVVIGLDFGRSPAAIFMQAVNNRILVQYELLGFNEGAVTFAPKVKRFLADHYPNFPIRLYGDPKGQDKTQNDERTAFDIFEHVVGMRPMVPPGLRGNMISTRVDAVAAPLNEMYDGKPRFVLSPFCRTLKVGMAGRYHNERDEQGELKPCKDRYSHAADALQYGILGLGEGRRMSGKPQIGDVRPAQVYHGRRTMRRVVA